MSQAMMATTFSIGGLCVFRTRGVARGARARSRWILGTTGGALQNVAGGNITLCSELCEKTRAQAFVQTLVYAEQLGANAVIGICNDVTKLWQGVSEVHGHGTAVVVQVA